MPIYSLLCILPFVWSSFALQVQRRASSPPCQPFRSTFPAGSVSASRSLGDSSAFVAISPEGSYRAGSNGLELFMQKPEGGIVTRGGVNNKVADGATVNSTFTFLYVILFARYLDISNISAAMAKSPTKFRAPW